MKSYLQGMITGGVMVFATIVFMGQIKPLKLQNTYDPVEALKRKEEAKKKKKVDAQTEQVRKSQLRVDKQRLKNPVGKYNTGIISIDGGLIYWVTNTQTSDTYAKTYAFQTGEATTWGFNSVLLETEFDEGLKK